MKLVFKIILWILGAIVSIPIAIFILKFIAYLALIFISISSTLLNINYEEKELYSFRIEAMKDHNTYVTSRYGGNNQFRYYFIRNLDGEKIIGHTRANESSIIENGDSKVVVYGNVPSIFPNAYLKLAKWASANGNQYEFIVKSYKYHIPKGSVKYEYDIDME